MPSKKPSITVRCDRSELKEELEQLAASRGLTLNALINEVLEGYVGDAPDTKVNHPQTPTEPTSQPSASPNGVCVSEGAPTLSSSAVRWHKTRAGTTQQGDLLKIGQYVYVLNRGSNGNLRDGSTLRATIPEHFPKDLTPKEAVERSDNYWQCLEILSRFKDHPWWLQLRKRDRERTERSFADGRMAPELFLQEVLADIQWFESTNPEALTCTH